MIFNMAITKAQVANRALWVEALRSGKYEQTVLKLREGTPTDSCFCVWGVACDVADPSLWARADIRLEYVGDPWAYAGDLYTATQEVEEFYGLDLRAGGLRLGGTLISGNDSGDMNFDELADCIDLITLIELDEVGATNG